MSDHSVFSRARSTGSTILFLAATTAACATDLAAPPEELVGPPVGGAVQALNTPLSATMQFGQADVGSPFPPAADHDQSAHAKDNIVPGTVVIDRGGTVTFDVPAGAHQIAIYGPGTEPEDIDTGALVTLCPGSAPRLINDTQNRVALITSPCGSAWQAQYTFDTPGRYLVICAFLPHFQVGMYGWVEVRE
jgi:plastocyanin